MISTRHACCVLLVALAAGCASTNASLAHAPFSGEQVTIEYPQAQSGEAAMHSGGPMRISAPGVESLIVRDDPERGVLVPIVTAQRAIADGKWVLFGWSEAGEGLIADQALLVVRDPGSLRLADRLSVRRDRASAALLIDDRGSVLRIGVPAPAAEVPDPDEWKMRYGESSLDIESIRTLPFVPLDRAWPADAIYAPPSGLAGPAPTRAAWFEARDESFVLAAR